MWRFKGMFNLSGYYIPLESEYFGDKVPIRAHPRWDTYKWGDHLRTWGGYTYDTKYAQQAREDFLYDDYGPCYQGTGRLEDGRYIGCSAGSPWPRPLEEGEGAFFSWRTTTDVLKQNIIFETAATCDGGPITVGSTIAIPDLASYLSTAAARAWRGYTADTRLLVTGHGGKLCANPSQGRDLNTLDIFVGEGKAAIPIADQVSALFNNVGVWVLGR